MGGVPPPMPPPKLYQRTKWRPAGRVMRLMYGRRAVLYGLISGRRAVLCV